MITYDVVGTTKNGTEKIKFTNSEFNDIIFSIGRVHFGEDPNDPRLNFEYHIHMHPVDLVFDKDEFEETIAEFIVDRIKLGIEQNDLIYTGGIDED